MGDKIDNKQMNLFYQDDNRRALCPQIVVMLCMFLMSTPAIQAAEQSGTYFSNSDATQQYAQASSAMLQAVPNTYFDGVDIGPEETTIQVVVPQTLEEVISVATERHFPVEIAKDRISLAKRRLVKAIRDIFPAFNFAFDTTQGYLTQTGTRLARYGSDRFRFALRQPIYRGGSLVNSVRSELAGLHSAEGEYNKVFTDLALEVSTAYFSYARAKSIVSYRRALVSKVQDAARISEVKLEAELISEIEHLNVQSQQTRIESDYEQSKEQVALAELELQKLLNLDLDEHVDVYSLEFYQELGARDGNPLMRQDLTVNENDSMVDLKNEGQGGEAKELDQFINIAYENRPEFIIEREKVKSRRYAEKAVKGGYLPQADFVVEMGRLGEAFENTDPTPPFRRELRVGFEVSWNLGGSTLRYVNDRSISAPSVTGFAAGGGSKALRHSVAGSFLDDLDLFARAKEAEIQTKEAILELELAERQVLSEVKEAYYNYKRSLLQVRSALKRLTYRSKLVELAKYRSEVNEIQLSEYIQSEIDLVEEQNALYQAMADYFLAKAALNKAIGIQDFLTVDELDIDKPLREPSSAREMPSE